MARRMRRSTTSLGRTWLSTMFLRWTAKFTISLLDIHNVRHRQAPGPRRRQLSGGLSSLPDVLSRAKSGRRLGARDRFRCRTAGVMLEDARTRDIFAANLSTRHKPTLGAGRPRGGV